MIPGEWRQLSEGVEAGVLLAIDFESGRAGPGLGDLAPLLKVPFGMVQPTHSATGQRSGCDYVSDWAQLVRDHRLDVRAVLGYCAGGALACALAKELASTERRPAVVLFDPEDVSASMVFYQYTEAIQQFTNFLSADEMSGLIEHAREVCGDQDLTRAGRELPPRYLDLAVLALTTLGADKEIAEEMADRFTQYIEYLLASWQVGYAGSGEDTLTILSAGFGLPAGLAGEVRRFDSQHPELLTDPQMIAELTAGLTGSLD